MGPAWTAMTSSLIQSICTISILVQSWYHPWYQDVQVTPTPFNPAWPQQKRRHTSAKIGAARLVNLTLLPPRLPSSLAFVCLLSSTKSECAPIKLQCTLTLSVRCPLDTGGRDELLRPKVTLSATCPRDCVRVAWKGVHESGCCEIPRRFACFL